MTHRFNLFPVGGPVGDNGRPLGCCECGKWSDTTDTAPCKVHTHVVGNPPTPGDNNVMFLVLKLTRSKGKKKNIISAVPVGTSFALSDKLFVTAAHNVCNKKGAPKEIGIVRQYEDPVYVQDITVLTYVAHCSDKDEDWAIYKRSNGSFTHYAHICPESELPGSGVKIGIKDYPVGVLTVGSVTKITLHTFHTKISNYQVYVDYIVPTKSKKRKFGVTDTKPVSVLERAVQVVGGRVTRSCGSAYFAPNGKAIAFHQESVDVGREDVSISNSYTSDHSSYSIGLVFCRLPKFKIWYNNNFDNDLEH